MRDPRWLLPALLFTAALAACSPPPPPDTAATSAPPLSTSAPASRLPGSSPTPTAAVLPSSTPALPTATVSAISPEMMPTAAVTVTPRPGWRIYNNLYLGYSIQYPPDVSVRGSEMSGMDVNEPVPPGFSGASYFDYLRKVLPKDLCVTLSNQYGSVTIAPPLDWVGRYVLPCPGIGPGEGYRFEEASLDVAAGGQAYTASGTRLYIEATGEFDSEFYGFSLPNQFGIVYLGGRTAGMSEADYLKGRAALLTLLETLAWTRQPDMTLPGWTCAGAFTHLLPGVYAQVKADNNIPNRVRSAPQKAENIVAQLYPGLPFELLEGPVCADGLVFWKIRSPSIPGGAGWTAEGDGVEYYLEPYISQ